ncbi:MAG: hypothetical protein IKB16_01405 [Lentisphaeria bacterium]|nr:hypothetical protein [Lentisphaeria bacterium]
MADEKIKTSCPVCHTVYEVERDLLGERCKCADCGNDFDITENDKIAGGDEDVSTHAVKMIRLTQDGMIPKMEDEKYKVSTVTKTHQTAIGITRGTRKYGKYDKKKSFWDKLCFWKKN